MPGGIFCFLPLTLQRSQSSNLYQPSSCAPIRSALKPVPPQSLKLAFVALLRRIGRKSNRFPRYQLLWLLFFGEKERVSAKRQPHFSKAPIKVAFLLKDIIVSCRKGNPDSVKRILQLPFLRNAQGKVWKRATLIPQNAFCGCFLKKRSSESAEEQRNKSQSASPGNAINICSEMQSVWPARREVQQAGWGTPEVRRSGCQCPGSRTVHRTRLRRTMCAGAQRLVWRAGRWPRQLSVC